jgi:hypothetical protein
MESQDRKRKIPIKNLWSFAIDRPDKLDVPEADSSTCSGIISCVSALLCEPVPTVCANLNTYSTEYWL